MALMQLSTNDVNECGGVMIGTNDVNKGGGVMIMLAEIRSGTGFGPVPVLPCLPDTVLVRLQQWTLLPAYCTPSTVSNADLPS
jgi:hypothetical protein